MDSSDRVSVEDCPSCGGPATLWWVDADLVEIGCPNGCGLPLRPAQTAAFAASRDRDTIARVEVMIVLFEQAISDTAATFGLTDPRKAASLVADAWADVLRDEGRPQRVVVLATAAVLGIGDRMHRRQR